MTLTGPTNVNILFRPIIIQYVKKVLKNLSKIYLLSIYVESFEKVFLFDAKRGQIHPDGRVSHLSGLKRESHGFGVRQLEFGDRSDTKRE